MGLFVRAYLESDETNKVYEAREKEQPYKSKFTVELTEEQIDKMLDVTSTAVWASSKPFREPLNLTIEELAKNKIWFIIAS